jgi:hypothetical protein
LLNLRCRIDSIFQGPGSGLGRDWPMGGANGVYSSGPPSGRRIFTFS